MKKRILLSGLSVFILFLTLSFSGETYSKENHVSKISAEDAVKKLKSGNKRFLDSKRKHPNQTKVRLKLTSANGQKPYASFISCADSRVPLEHIFDAGFGDLFVVRVAGNVAGTNEIGTLEYGVEHLNTPVVVVIGHTKCGAVTAVVKGGHADGNIEKLLLMIKPAVKKAKEKYGEKYSEKLLNESIKQNIWLSIENIFKESDILKSMVLHKKVRIIGAIYHIDSGKIEWMGVHPKQANLLRK